jgi:hypothetical protein
VGFVHAGQPVQQALHGAQNGIQKGLLAGKDAGHENAKRFRQGKDHKKEKSGLQRSVCRNGQNFSGRSMAKTRYPKTSTQTIRIRTLASIPSSPCYLKRSQPRTYARAIPKKAITPARNARSSIAAVSSLLSSSFPSMRIEGEYQP